MTTSEPDPRQVSADDLRTLLAVARTGRMTSASSLLGIDHTTVRRRLDRLEQSLKVRLLDRGADGWELTETGRDVVARAAELDAIVESVVDASSQRVGSLRGFVRVVAPEGFGVSFVSPALAALQSRHPGISMEVVTSTRPLSMRGSGYDIAITVGTPGGARVPAELLAEYSVRLYASRDYLAQHPPVRSLEDLAAHPLVFYIDALLTVRDLDLNPYIGGMRVGFGSTNAFAQLEATRRSAGIGLLHAFLAEGDPHLVPVLPGVVDFRLAFSMTTRARGTAVVEAAAAAIRDEVERRAGELVPPA